MRADQGRVGGQIKNSPNLGNHGRPGVNLRKPQGDLQPISRTGLDHHHAARFANSQGSCITTAQNNLDPGNSPQSQESQHGLPVIGRAIGQPQDSCALAGRDIGTARPP